MVHYHLRVGSKKAAILFVWVVSGVYYCLLEEIRQCELVLPSCTSSKTLINNFTHIYDNPPPHLYLVYLCLRLALCMHLPCPTAHHSSELWYGTAGFRPEYRQGHNSWKYQVANIEYFTVFLGVDLVDCGITDRDRCTILMNQFFWVT